MDALQILVGVGRLYVAALGATFPAVNAVPSSSWTDLGETDDGVTVTPTQKVDLHYVDQNTGPVKATRSEEGLSVGCNLALATLENLAKVLGGTVTDTAAGSGTIGTRSIPLYRGSTVTEHAILLRGYSPYGDGTYAAQYQIPRGFFDGEAGHAYKKDTKTLIPLTLTALEDLSAASDSARFGNLVAQDAAAT